MHRRTLFSRFARWTSGHAGHPLTFFIAVALIGLWIVSGPLFDFSNTWQLMINTTTTIVTFLMVFLIQNTQNRENAALQIKVDELIRASEHSHNALLDLEELTDGELERIRLRYEHLAEKARSDLRKGKSDSGTPEI